MIWSIKKFLSAKCQVLRSRKGFTLLELVIFTAIFSVTIMAFISVLISITRTQVRQTAVTEVNQQSQFVLQAVQYYVERSSLIDLADNATTTSVTLRMPSAAEDPTLLYASGTQIFSQVGGDPPQALTSPRVLVSDFVMTKHANAPGKESLSVGLTISYNTSNVQQQFAQALQSAVSRVNAATFDSGVYPVDPNSVNNKIGASGSAWKSINDIITFNGTANVGIGLGAPPSSGFQGLQVHNGDVYVDTNTNGFVGKDSGGTCHRLTFLTNGQTTSSVVTCY